MILKPPRPTLFPYTTLFRSTPGKPHVEPRQIAEQLRPACPVSPPAKVRRCTRTALPSWRRPSTNWAARFARSEEHTSELQSQSNLVCCLLLEKKKIYITLCL